MTNNILRTEEGVWEFSSSLVRYRSFDKKRWSYLFEGRESGARYDKGCEKIARIILDVNSFDDDRYVAISDLLKSEGAIDKTMYPYNGGSGVFAA